MLRCSFLAPTPIVAICSFLAPTPVVVNEVLYDPVGSDRGGEYVEIINLTDWDICLDGWRLETGNGAYEDRWRVEWEGTQSETIPAHGFFVLGEESVCPAPDVVCNLDLQNGPDACRILGPGGEEDLVGWGDHEFSCYFESEPAECVPSGWSLARDPDGKDTGCNRADFTGLRKPTPGRYNHPPLDLCLKKACLSRYTSGGLVDLICVLSNVGLEAFGKESRIVAVAHGFAESTVVDVDIQPGRDMRFVVRLPNPGSGLHLTRVWVDNPHDLDHSNDSLTTTFLIQPPPVVLNEILFCTSGNDCEWIELYCQTDEIDLNSWTLEDSQRRPIEISRKPLVLTQGDFILFVEDEDVFKMKHPDVASDKILRPAGGWLSLNDSDNPLGFADKVVIRDRFATAVDSVAYREDWTSCGISTERIDPGGSSASASNWSPHYGEGNGSPGKPNTVSIFSLEGKGFLKIAPRVMTPNGDGRDDIAAIRIDLPEASEVELGVYDVTGVRIVTLISGTPIEAGRTTFWNGLDSNGRQVRTGIYLVVLKAKGRSRDKVYSAKLPLVLIRR